MSASTSLVTFASLQNDTSATTDLNTNFSAINTALTGCLSLTGQSPNQMQAVLDMNSNRIINLPTPASNFDAVRFIDITSLGTGGTITINPLPTGGSTGQVLTKNSNTNFDVIWSNVSSILTTNNSFTGTNTFTNTLIQNITGSVPGGSGDFFGAFYNVTGTNTGGANYFIVNPSDNANLGSSFGNAISAILSFGGSSTFGGRQGILGEVTSTAPTAASNTNRNYVGTAGVALANSSDNGTGTGVATGAGAFFGSSAIAGAFAGATNLFGIAGCELNAFVATGASTALKSILQLSADNRDRVQGAVVDTMIWAYNQANSAPGWNQFILVDATPIASVGAVFPIKSTGTIFKVNGGTVATGIDFSGTTFTGTSINVPNFQVDGTGNLKVLGTSSGTVQISAQATAGSPVLTLPNTTGTLVSNATAPLSISSTTGNISVNTNGVTNSLLAQMPANTLKGNNTGGTANAADLTVANVQTMLNQNQIAVTAVGVNFNSANTDTSITIPLPTGVSNYLVTSVRICNPSAALSTATFGLFTASGGGGVAILPAGTAITITTAAANTNNNAQNATPVNNGTQAFNSTPLFFRVGTAQGSAATGDVILNIVPLY